MEMKSIFSVSGPETLGLAVLGATVGAVVCGAASTGGLSGLAIYGAAIGGVALPVSFRINWSRVIGSTPKMRKTAQS